MNFHIKDTILTDEEFNHLAWSLGEHRRVCREQNNSPIGKKREELTESLIYKLLIDVKNKNVYTK